MHRHATCARYTGPEYVRLLAASVFGNGSMGRKREKRISRLDKLRSLASQSRVLLMDARPGAGECGARLPRVEPLGVGRRRAGSSLPREPSPRAQCAQRRPPARLGASAGRRFRQEEKAPTSGACDRPQRLSGTLRIAPDRSRKRMTRTRVNSVRTSISICSEAVSGAPSWHPRFGIADELPCSEIPDKASPIIGIRKARLRPAGRRNRNPWRRSRDG